jgi:prepilin-type N-terminal cleavage/methylation domain-containing protein
MKAPLTKPFQAGFSLVELTIVLIIIALLSTGLMFGVSAQRKISENTDVQRQIEGIREVLIGFAMTNGRLPCPADPTLLTEIGGNEDQTCVISGCPKPPTAPVVTPPIPADVACSRQYGVIPWKSLGIIETDPWGSRFTYFVGFEFSNPLTYEERQNGMRSRFKMETNGSANIEDGASNVIASDTPAVIVSHGSRAAGAYLPIGKPLEGATGDEKENSNETLKFIAKQPNDAFDDIVTWVVPSILKSRMVAAGRLP